MFIPLGTDRALRRPTVVNHAIIAACFAAYIAQLTLANLDPDSYELLVSRLSLHRGGAAWSYVTYAFLHNDASPWHLLGNMLILWVFGPSVEDRFTRVGYLVFYLLGGAAAGLAQVFFSPGAPVIGASGAIAAVTGAFLVLFPFTHIRTLVLFFFFGLYMVPAWVWGAIAVLSDFLPVLSKVKDGVAREAHLGGYVFGAGVSMALLALRVLKREPYDLFTIARQAARRRHFREAMAMQTQRGPVAAARAAKPDPAAEAVMQARAAVSERMAAADLPGAAAAYRRLLDAHATTPGACLLSRRHQYDLANYLFQSGDHTTAATAYDAFLAGYPTDSESPVVRLMLGLISARYLNDPVRAKREIAQAEPRLDDANRRLARELMAELG